MAHNARQPYSRDTLEAIAKIKEQIDQFPLKFKTAAELLTNLPTYNRKALEKAFKDAFGLGLKKYLVRQRLEASKYYLEMGMPNKQIAATCFYSSASAFCDAFKKVFGLNPTEWVDKSRGRNGDGAGRIRNN